MHSQDNTIYFWYSPFKQYHIVAILNAFSSSTVHPDGIHVHVEPALHDVLLYRRGLLQWAIWSPSVTLSVFKHCFSLCTHPHCYPLPNFPSPVTCFTSKCRSSMYPSTLLPAPKYTVPTLFCCRSLGTLNTAHTHIVGYGKSRLISCSAQLSVECVFCSAIELPWVLRIKLFFVCLFSVTIFLENSSLVTDKKW